MSLSISISREHQLLTRFDRSRTIDLDPITQTLCSQLEVVSTKTGLNLKLSERNEKLYESGFITNETFPTLYLTYHHIFLVLFSFVFF